MSVFKKIQTLNGVFMQNKFTFILGFFAVVVFEATLVLALQKVLLLKAVFSL